MGFVLYFIHQKEANSVKMDTLNTAVNLNINKMIGRVSELHDGVNDTIFSITQDKLRFGNDLIFIYLYSSLNNGEY